MKANIQGFIFYIVSALLFLWIPNIASGASQATTNITQDTKAGSISKPSEKKKVLRIYTTRSLSRTIEKYILKDFEATHNCKLEFISTQGIETILTEIQISKKPRGDLILGLNYDACRTARLKKYLKPHQTMLGNISKLELPIAWTDPYLIPIQFGFISFVYDKNKIEFPPKSFEELAAGKYKVILSDPRTSTTGQSLLFWIKSVYDNNAAQFWQRLKPNILTFTRSWSEAYSLFLKGEAPIVLSYTTSELYHKLQEKNDNIAASHFQEGQYLEVLVAAVLNNSENHELASKLLAELLNEPFQKACVFGSWNYPVRHFESLPIEFKRFPVFVTEKYASGTENDKFSEDWDSFKQKALDEWLEALSS